MNRQLEQLISCYTNDFLSAEVLAHLLADDSGVIKNLGRQGSRFAPQAILNILFKMNQGNEKINWASLNNYDFKDDKKHFYLGGGHDHIYPILMEINKYHQDITVINIDPHLDTRVGPDLSLHSGNPFRLFDRNHCGKFELIQLGFALYANSLSTRSPLLNSKQRIISIDDFDINLLPYYLPYNPNTFYFLSLDADVIDAGSMEGVSAPAHRGMKISDIHQIFSYTKDHLNCRNLGIFEYNPLYDNLSQKGARALAALIYGFYFKN